MRLSISGNCHYYAAVPSSRKTVLVVEDDDDLRHLFRDALRFAGFDVREAADGPDALHIVDLTPPDVVVLDIRLPTLDGVSVREELAANPRTKSIPVVVVTGTTSDVNGLKNVRLLRKPVPPEDLIANVRGCLAAAMGRGLRIRGQQT